VETERLSKAPELNPQVCSDEKTTEDGTHPVFVDEICAQATWTVLLSFRLQPFQSTDSPFPFYIYGSARINKHS